MVTNVSSVSSNPVPASSSSNLQPIPTINYMEYGSDPLQQQFLESLDEFVDALNLAIQNPNNQYYAMNLQIASENLMASWTALDDSGVAADQQMAANAKMCLDSDPTLENLFLVASNPDSTTAEIENAVAPLENPVQWAAATNAILAFYATCGDTNPYDPANQEG